MSRFGASFNRVIALSAWIQLFDQLSELQSQPCIWLNEPPTETTLEKCLAYNQFVLESLIALLSDLRCGITTDDTEIREFLVLCSKYTMSTSLDITFNPEWPANRALHLVAEQIAKPNETVCQILMPTIRRVVGSGFLETDIKSASENNKGKFVPQYFLTSTRGDTLIAVSDLFFFTQQNTSRLFPVLSDQPDPAEPVASLLPDFVFDITDMDRHHLRSIAGSASADYFDALKTMHYQRLNKKPSFGLLLQELATALLKSSVADHGSEFFAEITECKIAILQCFAEWNHLLSDVKQYKANGATSTLGEYLLFLFASVGAVITEQDRDEITHSRIPVLCAEQFSGQLNSIISAHPDLFLIPLTDCHDQHHDHVYQKRIDHEQLQRLSDDFEKALAKRMPLLSDHDEQLVLYDRYFRLAVNDYILHRQTMFDIRRIVIKEKLLITGKDFGTLLLFFPSKVWYSLLALLPDFYRHFSTERPAVRVAEDTAALLRVLPSTDWSAFFSMIADRYGSVQWSGLEIAYLMYFFSKAERPVLIDAMTPLLTIVMSKVKCLFEYWGFYTQSERSHAFSMIKNIIAPTLSNPKYFATLIRRLSMHEWTDFLGQCEDILTAMLNDITSLPVMLENIPIQQREYFLHQLMPWISKITLTQPVVLTILNALDVEEWSLFLSRLGAQRIQLFIPTIDALKHFLHPLSAKKQLYCVIGLRPMLPNLPINAVSLQALLLEFHELGSLFGAVFVDELPVIFSDLLASFSIDDQFAQPIHPEKIKIFMQLSEQVLPIVLANWRLFYMDDFPLSAGLPQDYFDQLVAEFKTIENDLVEQRLSAIEANLKKLWLLEDFEKRTQAQEFVSGVLHMRLFHRFRNNFFSKMRQYLQRFYHPSFVLATRCDASVQVMLPEVRQSTPTGSLRFFIDVTPHRARTVADLRSISQETVLSEQQPPRLSTIPISRMRFLLNERLHNRRPATQSGLNHRH